MIEVLESVFLNTNFLILSIGCREYGNAHMDPEAEGLIVSP